MNGSDESQDKKRKRDETEVSDIANDRKKRKDSINEDMKKKSLSQTNSKLSGFAFQK